MVIKKLSYPVNVRNILRKDRIVHDQEELFEHLVTDASPRPIHIQMLAGKLVSSSGKVEDSSVISPDLFITQDTLMFMNLFNRYKRYGWTPLYGNDDIPNIVLEAFDCIENTIAVINTVYSEDLSFKLPNCNFYSIKYKEEQPVE